MYNKKIDLISNQLDSWHTYFGINFDGSAWFLITGTRLFLKLKDRGICTQCMLSPHLYISQSCMVRFGSVGVTGAGSSAVILGTVQTVARGALVWGPVSGKKLICHFSFFLFQFFSTNT
jgi:hypothetical protein